MSKLHRRILILTLAASVIVRVIAAIYLGNKVEVLPGTFDQVSYHNLALRVVSGNGFTFGEPWWPATAAGAPTAHWSYLYTGYLILIYKIFGLNPLAARIIQAVIVGLLQPYLAYRIARYLFNPVTGLAAAILTAIYTYFVYYSATLMTEPFYIVAILASLWIGMRMVRKEGAGDSGIANHGTKENLWMGLGLGLTLGIAVLMRQLFLLFIPFLFIWIWWASGKRMWRSLLISGSLIILMVLPFTIFNYLRFDRFVLLNTNAGYALFWSNHPIYGTQFVPILTDEMGSYLELIPEELLSLDEAALDQELLKIGIGFVVQDPLRYLALSISRIPPYFVFWPSSSSSLISNISRVSSFGIMLPFMLYGLFRSYIERAKPLITRPLFLLYLFMLVYTGIHVLTWTLIRYRMPVDAVLVIFAGLAVVDLMERVPLLKKWVSAAA
ncbi:MAG: glycosyltransferase family 39 protein [Anaerolineales bacterium]|nr:glycosyltransferase family 39 protein [Anaerolineales bacterium]